MLSGGHFLASHDLTTEGSPALTELIDLEAQRRRIDHRQAVLLTEVAASGVCDIEHGHTTPMWLADRTQQSPHACRSRMNTAARLHRRYPQLAEALKTGRVGWQHVKVIDSAGNDRNWQDLADLLPGLIDLAQVATFERWAREVRGIAQRLDQDGGYDPASDPANNHLHLVPTTDGITYVSGQLVGELALTIKKLIDGETERVLKRYRADAEATGGETPVPSRAQACAEALGELVDRGSGVPEGSGKLPEPEIVVILNDTGDTEDGGELTDDDGNHLSPHILRFIIAAASTDTVMGIAVYSNAYAKEEFGTTGLKAGSMISVLRSGRILVKAGVTVADGQRAYYQTSTKKWVIAAVALDTIDMTGQAVFRSSGILDQLVQLEVEMTNKP